MKIGTMPDPEDPGSASSGSSGPERMGQCTILKIQGVHLQDQGPGRVGQCLILKIQAVHLQGQAVQKEWDNA